MTSKGPAGIQSLCFLEETAGTFYETIGQACEFIRCSCEFRLAEGGWSGWLYHGVDCYRTSDTIPYLMPTILENASHWPKESDSKSVNGLVLNQIFQGKGIATFLH